MTEAQDIADLEALARRCEEADTEQQREMLEAAFSAIYPGLPLPHCGSASWPPRLTAFVRMLDASAFESAAMSLVPEGWRFEVTTTGFKPGASLVTPRGTFSEGAYAATPALALTAASLRARAHLTGERK